MWYSFLPTSVNRTFINTFIPLFELIISGFFVIQTFFCLNFLANSGCQYFCQFLSDFLRKASLVDFIQFLQLGVTLFNLRRYFLSLFDLALKQLFCICKSILCYVNSTSAWVILYDRYWTSSALSVGAYDFSWILRIYLIFDLLGELGSSWGSGYWGCWGGWGSVYAIIKLIYSQWIIKIGLVAVHNEIIIPSCLNSSILSLHRRLFIVFWPNWIFFCFWGGFFL